MISSPRKYANDLHTRITDHSKTLIDHIYVNDFKHTCISGVALSDLSDDFGTFVIMIAKATKSIKNKRYQILGMSILDHKKFQQNLTNDLKQMLLIITKVSTSNLKKFLKYLV